VYRRIKQFVRDTARRGAVPVGGQCAERTPMIVRAQAMARSTGAVVYYVVSPSVPGKFRMAELRRDRLRSPALRRANKKPGQRLALPGRM